MRKATSLLLALVMVLTMLAGTAMAQEAYTGSAMGNNGEVTVSVYFEGNQIASIEAQHSETAGLGDVAIARLIDEMVASQSVAVDTVAGATNSSKAVIAAVTQAIEAAGLNVEDYMGPVDTAVQATEDMSCDVVIVGAGGAGMVAALQAVEDGAQSVVLLEKMGATGGNTVRSTGGMNAAGTPEQAVMEFTESAGVEKTLESAAAGRGQ